MSEAAQFDVSGRAGAASRTFAGTGAAIASGPALLSGLALAKLVLQFAGIDHYGFFRDELYYMACGEHLAWGYVDQPPLIALIAWFARHLFGSSLFALRLLPAIAGAGVVFLTGCIARELGGGRFAQFMASTSILLAPAYLAFDTFFSMNAFEPLFWMLCAWIAVRIVKGASPKMWLGFGAIAGVGLENKHTMLVFGFGLVAGLLIAGKWQLFRSKWIWFGGLIALAIFLPNLIWEARHGWPQIEVVRNAQQFKNVPVSAAEFLFEQILFLHPLSLPLWIGGLSWLFFSREGKRYCFLGWAYLIVLAIFMSLDGKTYYVLPAYPMLMAAGGVAFERFVHSRNTARHLKFAYPALLILGGLITAPFGIPLLPVETFLHYSQALPYASVKTERDATAPLPQLYADMFGWQDMAATVSRVYHALPQAEQPGCAILGGNYGEAGAIDYFGPKLGLPKAISGHNSYFYWGPRNYSGNCVILFGDGAEETRKLFGDVQQVATITNRYAMPGEQNLPVYLCSKPSAPLSELWPHFKLII
jgi:hypothetical protein